MPLNEMNVYGRDERGLSSAHAQGVGSNGNRTEFPADLDNE